tara:strand:- start:5031 stop:5414 length:384 start_codon:yes stop_codon:yes gene_type:complete
MKKLGNFRQFTTSEKTKIIAGKNQEQNEELVKKYIGKNNLILHTAKPGSPFCIIKKLKPTKQDLEETAIFCAKYSQSWKKPKIKRDVEVHVFSGKNVYKDAKMKTGTFGVKKKKKIIVKKEDIEKFK